MIASHSSQNLASINRQLFQLSVRTSPETPVADVARYELAQFFPTFPPVCMLWFSVCIVHGAFLRSDRLEAGKPLSFSAVSTASQYIDSPTSRAQIIKSLVCFWLAIGVSSMSVHARMRATAACVRYRYGASVCASIPPARG